MKLSFAKYSLKSYTENLHIRPASIRAKAFKKELVKQTIFRYDGAKDYEQRNTENRNPEFTDILEILSTDKGFKH